MMELSEAKISTEFDKGLEEMQEGLAERFDNAMIVCSLMRRLKKIGKLIRRANMKHIDETMPWKLAKAEERAIRNLQCILRPMLKITSEKILEQLMCQIGRSNVGKCLLDNTIAGTKVKRR